MASGGASTAPHSPFLVGGKVFSIEYEALKSEDPTQPKKGLATVRGFEGDASTALASFEYPMANSRPFLFPLENGKWFAINVNGEKDGRPTQEVFFHLRGNEKGLLAVDDVLPSGLGELLKVPEVRLAIRYARPVLFSETHGVICLFQYGLLWSVRLKDGQLSGPFRIYDGITDKRITTGSMLRPIVNLQPAPDGRILIAARTEEAVLKGGEMLLRIEDYQRQIVAGFTPGNAKDSLKSVRSMWDSLYVTFPFVHWLEFNPGTGGFKRLNPPPFGAKEMIQSHQEFGAFLWLMDARDDVLFFDDSLSGFKDEVAPEKQPEPKAAPAKQGKKVPKISKPDDESEKKDGKGKPESPSAHPNKT